jgi:FkbM family methyltransferase
MLLDDLQIDCVLDVGANTGQYGRMLRRLGYRGQIVSFEPVAATFGELTEAVAGDGRWSTVQVALGAEDGTADINVSRGSDMASLLDALPAEDAPLSEVREVVRVETITTRRLDSIWSELPGSTGWSRVFLKLDTQGYDLEVLTGGVDTITSVVAVQSEVSVIPVYRGMPTWLESMERFAELGFEPTGMFPVTFAGRLRTIEFDCVMVRRSAAASDS